MFNPQPRLERVPLAGEHSAWVVDNVLLQADDLVEQAVRGRSQFKAAPFNAYPGLEWHLGDEVTQPLADFFTLHVRKLLGARRTLSRYSRLSIATLQPHELRPLQRLCHRDRFGVTPGQSVAACTLYLFKDTALGGTSFFMPRQPPEETNALIRRWHEMDGASFTRAIGREPGYITAGNEHFDLVCAIPAAYNRAVFYDGSLFHSSHIQAPERLSADPARGRLTLNGFFICRRNAA